MHHQIFIVYDTSAEQYFHSGRDLVGWTVSDQSNISCPFGNFIRLYQAAALVI